MLFLMMTVFAVMMYHTLSVPSESESNVFIPAPTTKPFRGTEVALPESTFDEQQALLIWQYMLQHQTGRNDRP